MSLDARTRTAILEAARMAPSADNSQPWTYCWRDGWLELRIDPSRAGGVSDRRFVLSDLALGACVENISVQARSLGYQSTIDLLPEPGGEPLWVARIQFAAGPPGDGQLAAAIPRRQTDRSFPWGSSRCTEGTRAMSAAAEQLPGVSLVWMNAGPEYRAALKALRIAEGLRFRSKRLHAELFGSVRFDKGRKGIAEEGLTPATLGIGALEWPGFRLMRYWPAMRLARMVGADHVLAMRSAVLPVLKSGALGVLCVTDTERVGVVRGGRGLERAWLAATSAGLAVQPYAAPGVLGLGLIDIEPAHRQRLARLRDTLRGIGCKGHPLMFLRVGDQSDTSAVRGGRRPLSDFESCLPQG